MLLTHVHSFVSVSGVGCVEKNGEAGPVRVGWVTESCPSCHIRCCQHRGNSRSQPNINKVQDLDELKGREYTNTVLLVPILIHPSIRIQLSGKDHLGEFSATSRGPGFLAEDAVEIAVEDAGVGRGEPEED
jgi:hypothetical protein